MSGLRFGVLGCAAIARRRMLPALTAHPDVELASVASRDGRKAAEVARAHGCRAVTGYAALLADDAIDAVYIPLPAALHATWVARALRAGKHVLAEKPLSTGPDVTRHLVRLARERGLALLENVMFVHHGQHAAVRGLLDGGAIGGLRAFHACFTIPALPAGDIRYDPALGGGSLDDVGVYPVRAAVHFVGGGLDVVGAVLASFGGHAVDTSGSALLRSGDGVAVQLSFGFDHAYRATYELWGERGRIVVDRAFTPPADLVPRVRVETSAGVETVGLPPDDQVANTLSAFVTAVRSGGAVPHADTLAQADLLGAIREAAGSRRPA